MDTTNIGNIDDPERRSSEDCCNEYDNCFRNFVEEPLARGELDKVRTWWEDEFKEEKWGGGTALHWACWYMNGDREGVVREVISRGCDIEAEATWCAGWRPLHYCASWGNRGATRALLGLGCCLTARTPGGETALQLAESGGHSECATMLRTAMQKAEYLELLGTTSFSEPDETRPGRTFLDKLLKCRDDGILAAVKAKRVTEQEVDECRTPDCLLLNSDSIQRVLECLVYRCIHQNHVDGVYTLCTPGIVNGHSLFMGPTALETAVQCGSVIWVHEILRRLMQVDESWERALATAVEKKLREVIEMISTRRDYFNRKTEKGFNRYHIAVIEDDSDMVQHLFNELSCDDECQRNLGTALSLAYSIDHVECARQLQAYATEVNTVDRFRQSPLHVAISNRTEENHERLVDQMRDTESTDIFGLTVLAQSILNGCREICERLVGRGAVCGEYIDMTRHPSSADAADPETRLCVITRRETAYSLCLKSHRSIYPCLLETIDSRSANMPDGNDNTLLHLAAALLLPELCSQLILRCADVNAQNHGNSTPLLELLKQNRAIDMDEGEGEEGARMIATIDVLVAAGATLNAADIDGCSVLDAATEYRNEGVLLSLVDAGEPLGNIKHSNWLAWVREKHLTVIDTVLPLMGESLSREWVTRELVRAALRGGDTALAKAMYDHAAAEVRADVVEAMLHGAAVGGDRCLFVAVVDDAVSVGGTLEGGESLLGALIAGRRKEFIELAVWSRNGPRFMGEKGADGKLALHRCIECEYWGVMEQLVIETGSGGVDEEDGEGNTALAMLLGKVATVARTGDATLASRLMSAVRQLIRNGADIYAGNRGHGTVIACCTDDGLRSDVEAFFRGRHSRGDSAHAKKDSEPINSQVCPICESQAKDCALSCGHMFCAPCAEKAADCYVCRRAVKERIRLFV